MRGPTYVIAWRSCTDRLIDEICLDYSSFSLSLGSVREAERNWRLAHPSAPDFLVARKLLWLRSYQSPLTALRKKDLKAATQDCDRMQTSLDQGVVSISEIFRPL